MFILNLSIFLFNVFGGWLIHERLCKHCLKWLLSFHLKGTGAFNLPEIGGSLSNLSLHSGFTLGESISRGVPRDILAPKESFPS